MSLLIKRYRKTTHEPLALGHSLKSQSGKYNDMI